MALRKELLKSIWYAFTALDVEKSGKVSKSQLKVRGVRGAWGGGGSLATPVPIRPVESQAWKPLLLGRHLALQQPRPLVEWRPRVGNRAHAAQGTPPRGPRHVSPEPLSGTKHSDWTAEVAPWGSEIQ